jgi:hypothetical protein
MFALHLLSPGDGAAERIVRSPFEGASCCNRVAVVVAPSPLVYVAVAGRHNPTLKPPEAMAAEPKAFNPNDSTSPPPQPQQNKHQPTKPFLFSTIDHVAAASKQQRHKVLLVVAAASLLSCCCAACSAAAAAAAAQSYFGDLIFPEAGQRRAEAGRRRAGGGPEAGQRNALGGPRRAEADLGGPRRADKILARP